MDVHVPAVHEVAVETITCDCESLLFRVRAIVELTCSVSLREDEPPTSLLLDIVYAVEDLEEEMSQLDGVSRRTNAIIDLRHVRYVAVICLVKIDPVPAALELYLSP